MEYNSQAKSNDTSLDSIDLNEIEDNADITSDAGAALASRVAMLEQGNDSLLIKYTFENPSTHFHSNHRRANFTAHLGDLPAG